MQKATARRRFTSVVFATKRGIWLPPDRVWFSNAFEQTMGRAYASVTRPVAAGFDVEKTVGDFGALQNIDIFWWARKLPGCPPNRIVSRRHTREAVDCSKG